MHPTPPPMNVEENLTLDFETPAGWDARIHVARCGEMVRAYLIESQRYLLVYDTLLGPQSGAWLRAQAERLAERRTILVVNSHADWDHYYGNQNFEDLLIVGSQSCRDRILGDVGRRELEKKRAESPSTYGGVRLVAPSLCLHGSGLIDGGDLSFHLLPTEGHRPDHLALYIPEIATLLPGDCVEDPIPLVDEDSDLTSNTVEQLVRSLESMIALKPRWVLANHAAPESGTERVESNLAYLRRLQKGASEASSLEELQDLMPAESSWGDFYREAHSSQTRMAWEQRKTEH